MPFNSTATPEDILTEVSSTQSRLEAEFGQMSGWPKEVASSFQQLLIDGIKVLQPGSALPTNMTGLRTLHRLRSLQFDSQICQNDVASAAATSRRLGPVALILGDLPTVGSVQYCSASYAASNGYHATAANLFRAAAATFATLGNTQMAESASESAQVSAQQAVAQQPVAPAPVPTENPAILNTEKPAIASTEDSAIVSTANPTAAAAEDWTAYIEQALEQPSEVALGQLQNVLESAGKTNGPDDDHLAEAIIRRIEVAFDAMLPPAQVEDVHEVNWASLGRMVDAKKFAAARDRYHSTLEERWDALLAVAVKNSADIDLVNSVFDHALPFLGLEYGPSLEQVASALNDVSTLIRQDRDVEKLQKFAHVMYAPMAALPDKAMSAELLHKFGLSLPREAPLLPLRKQFLNTAAKNYDASEDKLMAGFSRLDYAVDLAIKHNFRDAHDILQSLYAQAQTLRDLSLFAAVALQLSRSWAHAKRYETASKVIQSVLSNFSVADAPNAETRRVMGKLMMDGARYLHIQSQGSVAQAGRVRAMVSQALKVFMDDGFTEEMAAANRFLATGQF